MKMEHAETVSINFVDIESKNTELKYQYYTLKIT